MAANDVVPSYLPGELPEIYRTDEEQGRKDRLVNVHTSADSGIHLVKKINASTRSSLEIAGLLKKKIMRHEIVKSRMSGIFLGRVLEARTYDMDSYYILARE